VYRLALAIARWAGAQAIPTSRKHLRDQLVRAADSMVLNIAEGSGREPGDARRNDFRIAAGSAAEVGSILDLVALRDGAERQKELRRVVAMLTKLARR
jgi:four helix bundle protein